MYWFFVKNNLIGIGLLKFIYSEKATKFCEIFTLLLTKVHTVKSKVKISQNFVAFSKFMNFTNQDKLVLATLRYLAFKNAGTPYLYFADFNLEHELNQRSLQQLLFTKGSLNNHAAFVHEKKNIFVS